MALLLLSATVGCSQSPGPTATPAQTASPTARALDGSSLPDKVAALKGMAVVSVANDFEAALGKDAPIAGGYFLLVSPTDPQKAVLVCVPGMKADELAKKPSGVIEVSGQVKKFSAPSFKKLLVESHKLTVAGVGDDLQCVVAEGEVFPVASPKAPPAAVNASSTPTK